MSLYLALLIYYAFMNVIVEFYSMWFYTINFHRAKVVSRFYSINKYMYMHKYTDLYYKTGSFEHQPCTVLQIWFLIQLNISNETELNEQF